MERTTRAIQILSLHEQDEETGLENTTQAERLLMVWSLTLGAWVFRGEDLAESRLQRHTVRLFRKER